MEQDRLSREEIIATYKADVERLIPFLPWLEKKSGQVVAERYAGQDIAKNSVTFPVYDSAVLQFVREAKKTRFIDKNYVYVYSRLRIHTLQDERRAIENATLQDMGVLGGILSKYIIKGMTRGNVWQEGVSEGVFLAVITKMQELMGFWDKSPGGH